MGSFRSLFRIFSIFIVISGITLSACSVKTGCPAEESYAMRSKKPPKKNKKQKSGLMDKKMQKKYNERHKSKE